MSPSQVTPSYTQAFADAIDAARDKLRYINQEIHGNPEVVFQEVHAHDIIVEALRDLGFKVTPHAYGVPTSMQAEYGTGGRLVVFNAEYDALPEIGHACGHNLIAIASISGFLAAAEALKVSGEPGRVRLLGTPAEEGGCGKGLLVSKGAYKDVDACIMAHPSVLYDGYSKEYFGRVYAPHVATSKFTITFKGKTAHAAAAPWDGVNALDAIVIGYNAVSMLRQQIRTTDRIHGVILDGGLRSNIIPDHSLVDYCVRSSTIQEAADLRRKVINCFKAGALASGCTMEVQDSCTYASMRPNKLLCKVFSQAADDLDMPMTCETESNLVIPGGTDQGNVALVVPAIHPIYGIVAKPTDMNHTIGFTAAAGADDSFERTLKVGNALARTAWAMLMDDEIATSVKQEFEESVAERRKTMSAEEEWEIACSYDHKALANGGISRSTICACGKM
ncbi:hypothetical protein ACHAPJ_013015 [Fusarium lateritium]